MAEINWKSKYNELKSKYMNDVDTAYRLGCEQGMQMAQQQQAQQQAAQQDQAQEQEQSNQENPSQETEERQQKSENPHGSELDQHISTLEGMMGKSELTQDDLKIIKKSFEDLKFGIDMKKSDNAVKGISKALKSKFSAPSAMSKSASANLNHSQKAALSMQEKIVSDIMSQWDSQESELAKSINSIVAGAGHK